MMWKHPIPHIRPMQDRDAERRGAPESGPGVRLTGVLWSSWALRRERHRPTEPQLHTLPSDH
eukprot:scaffold30234_cov33-Phaeocystis_antarctica.AAC.1